MALPIAYLDPKSTSPTLEGAYDQTHMVAVRVDDLLRDVLRSESARREMKGDFQRLKRRACEAAGQVDRYKRLKRRQGGRQPSRRIREALAILDDAATHIYRARDARDCADHDAWFAEAMKAVEAGERAAARVVGDDGAASTSSHARAA